MNKPEGLSPEEDIARLEALVAVLAWKLLAGADAAHKQVIYEWEAQLEVHLTEILKLDLRLDPASPFHERWVDGFFEVEDAGWVRNANGLTANGILWWGDAHNVAGSLVPEQLKAAVWFSKDKEVKYRMDFGEGDASRTFSNQ